MPATDPQNPAPGRPNPVEVPDTAPIDVPEPQPDVIDPGIGIPTGPSPAPMQPGTPGSPQQPGVA